MLYFLFFQLFILDAQNKPDLNTPKTYVANYTEEFLKIDGLANETAWKEAPFSASFIDILGKKKAKYETKVKMLWDKKYIYFYATLEDPHVWANLKKRDTIIFHDNDFEIFLDPDGDTHNYYEFEFNALNKLWDLFLTKPYRNGAKTLNDWDAKGLKSAVHVNGTLNNPNDKDKGWSIEVAIPLTAFKTSYFERINLENQFWRINFSRVHWDFQLDGDIYSRKKDKTGKLLAEYNWVWSPQGVIAMHQPETWGYVYFAKNNENKSFEIPKDEHIKWHLFELYQTLNNKKENALLPSKIILGSEIYPKHEVHETGFNIWAISPFSGKKIIINQHGKIIIK